MYLLFVDESGTHGGSHSFVLGGLAIHEDDAARMQRDLDKLVVQHVGPRSNLEEYEFHAGVMRNAKKPAQARGTRGPVNVWTGVPRKVRLALLEDAYRLIASFRPGNRDLAPALFGVVIDNRFRSDWPALEREQFGYEVLLNKFDVMLKALRRDKGLPNRGLVIHDRRVVAEQDIQTWTSGWRAAAGRVGQLRNLADVPLFTDSRASRLLQMADLVAYALYRRYAPTNPDDRYFSHIWPVFHRANDMTHGCVHFTPDYGQGACACEPCSARLQ